MLVEVCVQGRASAHAAGSGGADRVELCERLEIGGLTPAAESLAAACRGLSIPVHALIRPRPGDFRYSAAEFAEMSRGIRTAKDLGAAGVVLGLLRADFSIDRDRTAALVDLARPLSVTFHKAIDGAADPFAALDVLIALGVDRVLTSGQAPTAAAGLPMLRELHRHAAGRITLLPGGRIRAADLPALAHAGFTEVHVGSATGPPGQTSPDLVRRIVAAAYPPLT